MTPTDYRNATFASLRDELTDLRRAALQAWATHGPGTTAQVAAHSGLSLLTFRPRTTELGQCGLVECIGRAGHSGVYQVTTADAWAAWQQENHPTIQQQTMYPPPASPGTPRDISPDPRNGKRET